MAEVYYTKALTCDTCGFPFKPGEPVSVHHVHENGQVHHHVYCDFCGLPPIFRDDFGDRYDERKAFLAEKETKGNEPD